ncbi:ATP-dependent helicase [Candidatus Uhrbacteria bacterium]|nr:ATP-dependent helicase [Candidatus Uhrbacteria bacterium]
MRETAIVYEKELNPEQLAVVREGDGPVLVLAGAGSGKTRTITYRVAYLLEQGVLPQEILLLTFTNKAAREMLQRVALLLKREPVGLWGGTFHSVANRLLRRYASELGYSQNFTILDQEDSHLLMKVCLKELRVDTIARKFPSSSTLCGLVSYARNAQKPLREVVEKRYPNGRDLVTIIERLSETYEVHKHQADAMDFDDLLLNIRTLLREFPLVRRRLSEQFRFILVDEYQDTNTIQAEIIRLLSEAHGNVLIVGDDAQSIYSFRAAQIQNILRFPEIYPGTKTFRLTTNYRSTPEILAVANQSISHNMDQFEKELVAISRSLEKPLVVPAASGAEEARYIATRILELVNQGGSLSQMAVLFRAAFHSQALEFELMKRDIPYEYRGGLKFFERAHVKDVLAYVRVRANPKDEAAWLRLLGLQSGVGLATAQKILQSVGQAQTFEEVCTLELSVGKRAQNGWDQLKKTLVKLSVQLEPADLIRTVLTSEYRDYLEAQYPDFMDRLEDVEQFALFAEQTEDLQTFLSEVSLTDEYGAARTQEASGEDRLVLSTIHQAKGLEWDNVFVMHLADGKFPSPRATEEDAGFEEERRLFYVATTRARKRLAFTYPLTSGYDTLILHQPSVFLQELPELLLEPISLRGRTPLASPDEPVVVFDDLGERVEGSAQIGKSFLRNVDELL